MHPHPWYPLDGHVPRFFGAGCLPRNSVAARSMSRLHGFRSFVASILHFSAFYPCKPPHDEGARIQSHASRSFAYRETQPRNQDSARSWFIVPLVRDERIPNNYCPAPARWQAMLPAAAQRGKIQDIFVHDYLSYPSIAYKLEHVVKYERLREIPVRVIDIGNWFLHETQTIHAFFHVENDE